MHYQNTRANLPLKLFTQGFVISFWTGRYLYYSMASLSIISSIVLTYNPKYRCKSYFFQVNLIRPRKVQALTKCIPPKLQGDSLSLPERWLRNSPSSSSSSSTWFLRYLGLGLRLPPLASTGLSSSYFRGAGLSLLGLEGLLLLSMGLWL